MSQLSSFSNRFAKMTALAVLSSAVALTTGCATKRATSEVVVAPLGIPGGQGAYTGAVVVDNPVAVVDASDNMEAVVYFAFDSSEITAQAASVLNQHVSLLNANPGTQNFRRMGIKILNERVLNFKRTDIKV